MNPEMDSQMVLPTTTSAPMNQVFPSMNTINSTASSASSMKRSLPNDGSDGSSDAKMPRTDGQPGLSTAAASTDLNKK